MKSITEIERKYIEHSLGKGKVPDHKIHKKKVCQYTLIFQKFW